MSNPTADRLYDPLPAVYRLRDADQGEPLRALLEVLGNQLELLKSDIDSVYNNEFIETCSEWVVPYIGDLLGVRGLYALSPQVFSQRPYVANTLRYRRRKGTVGVLEKLARDVTGWPARAVEFFQLLATTQFMNHLREANLYAPDFRQTSQLEQLGGPFESAAHTADVRHILTDPGKYNITNVGLFLWRLQAYWVEPMPSDARAVAPMADGRYTFNPLGNDEPLFNPGQTAATASQRTQEEDVPGELRRRALYDELEARRQALADGGTPSPVYFGDNPVFKILADGTVVPPEQVLICDLSDPQPAIPEGWRRPATTKVYQKRDGSSVPMKISLAVDPKLGRIAFPQGVLPTRVQVNYAYGFSGDAGGGPYDRRASVGGWLDPQARPITWQIGVTQDVAVLHADQLSGAKQLVGSLHAAVNAWNAEVAAHPDAFGVIAILDSATYPENLTNPYELQIPAGSRLAIVAADWPLEDAPGQSGVQKRNVGRLVPVGLRPHIRGDIAVAGTAGPAGFEPGELVLDGLLVEGKLTVLPGTLGELRISHCTLVPDKGGLTFQMPAPSGQENPDLGITLQRSLCGPVLAPASIAKVTILESVCDAGDSSTVWFTDPDGESAGPTLHIESSTLIGKLHSTAMELGSNSIFLAVPATADTWKSPVWIERRQEGCVRFSYVPRGSLTPRRYHCQPDLALAGITNPKAQAAIGAALTPSLTSLVYGDPGYAQLSANCREEIRTGAADGSEMGVFGFLKQPQREANLRAALQDYLRCGLEAGFFFVT